MSDPAAGGNLPKETTQEAARANGKRSSQTPPGGDGTAAPAVGCADAERAPVPTGSASDLVLRPLGPEWDARWDALTGASPACGFMQSSAWAAFKRAEGYLTPRYGLFADGELCGGASLLLYPHGHDAGFAICPEGPLLPWEDTALARAGLRLLIAQTRVLAREARLIGLRIEPRLPPPRPSLLRNWTRAPVDLTPAHTLMLELTRSDAELLAALSPKCRYNLGLSRRHNVLVTESADLADLRPFHELFVETGLRGDFFTEPYGFFLNLGEALFPTGKASLLLARHEGELLAGMLMVFHGRRATYLYGASSVRRRNVMPNYALHWAAILAARARGCAEYDFYGYDPFEQPNHLFAGISRFKRQWGAQRVDSLGAHDLIFYDELADRVIERLNDT